ncbi:MAG: NAD(P)H-hydrate epimerase [Propionibacteriaceae bacterium]|jgi:hydroxyethylthiazole kinase-like uncharacterized protein yjeF|nr:NAD(P)H-hydrate epimerase [Propionibacteriaceae bacterium]
MFHAYSVASIREAEARVMGQIGDDALMQRAASGLAAVVKRELRERFGGTYARRVLLLIGSGNNGGDGLYAGVRLLRRGVKVVAWRSSERVHEAGWRDFLAAGGGEIIGEQIELFHPDLVIDAILGIGGKPGLRGEAVEVLQLVERTGALVVAVDLPSGLAPEPPFTRPLPPHFKADVTVTFGDYKLCHVLEPARSECGRIDVVDIGLGLDEEGTEKPVLRIFKPKHMAMWPIPGPNSDKYSRGVVGMDTGSAQYPGAGVVSVAGALKAGAGMVRFLGDPAVGARVVERYPNVVLSEGRVQAWVLGCGWGENSQARERIDAVLESGLPAVLDADALRFLPPHLAPNILLTPHAGELARMLDVPRQEVEADPLAHAKEAAERWNATVLLKGSTQIVASPKSYAPYPWRALPGPAWSAQAGSGDLLAGICGTLLAAGVNAGHAALLGASIQALAAEKAGGPVNPQDLELPIGYVTQK